MDFDPALVTYESLLDAFFGMHDATRGAHSVQYESLVLYHDARQAQAARAAQARYSELLGRPVATRIQEYAGFTLAEEYHQKYALRADRVLMSAMAEHYPDPAKLRDSTAAARLNGYLYGGASLVQLESELDGLGLDSAQAGKLLKAVGA